MYNLAVFQPIFVFLSCIPKLISVVLYQLCNFLFDNVNVMNSEQHFVLIYELYQFLGEMLILN